jgi:UDPglucose 6-dehydrogenase
VVTDPASAEMIKNASNAFLATKITFINAVANLCEAVNADVRDVALGMGYDPRIGPEFLQPGPGFGGSCFPKDTAALLHTAERSGYDFGLLRGVMEGNVRQRDSIVAKVRRAATGSLLGATVAVWGLTFKARTDDLRDSPALPVIEGILEGGALVRAYDPTVTSAEDLDARGVCVPHGLQIVSSPYEAVASAGVLVVMTEWDDFRWLDFERVAEAMAPPCAVVDARNLLDRSALRQLGFTYQGVGR